MPFTSTLISAGRVRTAAQTATSVTAFAGTRPAVSVDHRFDPGMAPSRLNAYVMRDAEVMHETVQKICPTAHTNRTVPAQF